MLTAQDLIKRLKKTVDPATEMIKRTVPIAGAVSMVNKATQPVRQQLSQLTSQNISQGLQEARQYRQTVPIKTRISSAFQDARQNPVKYSLYGQMAQSPVQPIRYGGKAIEGTLEGLSANLVDVPAPVSQNGADRLAYVGGNLLGMFNPSSALSLSGKAVSKIPVARQIQKPLGQMAGKLISQGGVKKVAGKALANLSQGLPMTVGYSGLKQAVYPITGQKYTKGDLAGDVGVDLATGALGAFPIMAGVSRMAKDKRIRTVLQNEFNVKEALYLLDNYNKLKPDIQIRAWSKVDDVAKKVIPEVVGSKEMKRLATSNPGEWMRTTSRFLDDALVQAKNPSIDIGLSTRELGGGQKPATDPLEAQNKKLIEEYYSKSATGIMGNKTPKTVDEVLLSNKTNSDKFKWSLDFFKKSNSGKEPDVSQTEIARAYSYNGDIDTASEQLRRRLPNAFKNKIQRQSIMSDLERLYNQAKAEVPTLDRTQLTGKALSTPTEILTKPAPIQTQSLELQKTKPQALPTQDNGLLSQPSQKTSLVLTPKDKASIPFYDKEASGQAAARAYLEEDQGKKVFNDVFARFVGKRDSAKTKAVIRSSKFTNIDRNLGDQVIKYLDGDLENPSKQVVEASQPFRQEYNKLYKEAKDSGINLKYLENYVPHFWKQSPEEVAQMFMSAKGKFPNAKERFYPTYSEGIQMGLTPKYTHPTQLLNAYVKGLEKAKANIGFMKELRDNGIIVNESVARSNPGFTPILAQGIGKNESMLGNETILVGNWYAPDSIARQINKVFSPQETTKLSILAKASGGFQDIYLSGGVPGTPLNAFTFGQVIKDVSAGRVTSPFVSIARSLSPQKSAEYFKSKAPIINMMQEDNIPVRTNLSIDRFIDADTAKKTLGEKIGSAWSTLVNEPTFARFMPMQMVDLYEKTLQGAIKSGKDEATARNIAKEVTKRFYGITTTDTLAKRSQITKDLATSFLFAPRYRESMISFWANNVKALKNPLAPENRMNVRFIIGATAMFAAYNALNREFTGNNIWENDKYKKDKLLIPMKDGTTLGIPFLPSVAYLPRTLLETGEALANGELDQAAGTALGFTSSLVRPVADVVRNKTYFGGPVYPYKGDAKEKYGAIGKYLATQYTAHPYVREAIDSVKTDKPPYQRVSRAMELPFRFYDSKTQKKDTPSLAKVGSSSVDASTDQIAIPQDQDTFNELYKDATDKAKFKEEKRMIEFDPTLDDREKQEKIDKLQERSVAWAQVLAEMENGHPEKVFEAQISTYKTGGGKTVEDRGEWVYKKLEMAKDDKELQELVNRMWEEKVLTTGSSGVAQYLEDNYGIELRYTGTDSRVKGGRGKKLKIGSTVQMKQIKVSSPQVSQTRIKFAKPQLVNVNQTRKIRIKPSLKLTKVRFA